MISSRSPSAIREEGALTRLYLVQHGEALPKEVDPDRPLSERGRSDAARMAGFLSRAGVRVARIAHSGKTRARETAEILAAAVAESGDAESRSGLAPMDPTEPVAEEAASWSRDTMLVGHLPFMGRLVSRLLSRSERWDSVAFRPGSVVCLERGAEGHWTIAWMIRPELLASSPEADPGAVG
jgi:phosphohistidine phosphatase